MEFEDEHDEEQEEEEEDEEITIPPPTAVAPQPPPQAMVQPSYDSVVGPNSAPSRPRVNHIISSPARGGERRSGVVRYRECLKNHAVSIGGHAVDGCGEFMAAGEEGTLDALKCAACNCHRNFHRKETDISGGSEIIPPHANPSPVSATTPSGTTQQAAAGGVLYPQFSAYYRTPAPHQHQHHSHSQQQQQHPAHAQHHHQYRPLAVLPSASGGTHSGDMADDMSHPSSSGGEGRSGGGGGGGGVGSGMMMVPKKRHRTKFTQEQKDKMLAFAENLGWRIQKHDEAAVQQFCAEVQVKRQVLKVWMHNNKHTLGR